MALFVFAFVGAVQEGLADLTRGQQAERTLIVFQANRFCPSTSRLPQDYAGTIAQGARRARRGADPGVHEQLPGQPRPGACSTACRRRSCGRPATCSCVAGDWGEFERQRDAALVGQARGPPARPGVGPEVLDRRGDRHRGRRLRRRRRRPRRTSSTPTWVPAADAAGCNVGRHGDAVRGAAGRRRRRRGRGAGDRRPASAAARCRPTRGRRACSRPSAVGDLVELIGLATTWATPASGWCWRWWRRRR